MFGMVGTAPVASASPAVNWGAIAACESGGNWSADTGNGFYGGLQFTGGTWRANGGVGSPQGASRAEQIRVAENVLRSQGLHAWPHCGSRGLTSGHRQASQPSRAASTQAAPAVSPAPASPAPTSAVLAGGSTSNPAGDYTIAPGDTLASIADHLNTPGGWPTLVDLNKQFLTDANLIYPGDKIATR
ncbi:MAG TPA: transglycosylase family protein [Pseudonocardiaceae bacterium]|nr:transglycosylase family protein [Pseudonocardiaceae bacterium]